MQWEQVTREQEHARIMREYADAPFDSLMAMLERQFALLHNRSQILLTLCGIVITTTGFSGRFIASTNAWAQWTVILSIVFALLAAGVVVQRVLHLHWLTGQRGDNRSAWLMRSRIPRPENAGLPRGHLAAAGVARVLRGRDRHHAPAPRADVRPGGRV